MGKNHCFAFFLFHLFMPFKKCLPLLFFAYFFTKEEKKKREVLGEATIFLSHLHKKRLEEGKAIALR